MNVGEVAALFFNPTNGYGLPDVSIDTFSR
jgi:hypothetical protein